jgi:ABC-type sulfate transport system permease component
VNRLFGAALWAATALALAFFVVPIAAIFLRVPPAELVDALGSDVARDALRVTLETTVVAQVVIVVVGTPAAYLIATRRFRSRSPTAGRMRQPAGKALTPLLAAPARRVSEPRLPGRLRR